MKKGFKCICKVFFASLMFLSSCNNTDNNNSNDIDKNSSYKEEEYNKILAPNNLLFNDETLILKWDVVSGANAYDVNVNGKVVSTSLKDNSYKISSSLFNKLKEEENYQIILSVRAKVLDENNNVVSTSTYKSLIYSDNSSNSYIVTLSYLDDGTFGISGISGEAKSDDYNNFIIDAKYGGIKVSRILSNAFYNERSLTNVTLPEGIEVIEDNAFDSCNLLKTINLPNTLTSIGANAFQGCSNLGKNDENGLIIPSSLKDIGEGAFEGCQYSKISFPDDCQIEEIKANTFSGLRETILVIPSSVKYIRENAFKENKSLLELKFATNSSLIEIGDNAFYSSFSTSKNVVSTIYFPSSLTTIGKGAFTSCKLKEIYFKKDSNLEIIKDEAFKSNRISIFGYENEVTTGDFQIINSLKSIGDNAFNEAFVYTESKEYKGCSKLLISDDPHLESIGANSFKASSSSGGLSDISILNDISTLTFIDSSAFENTTYVKNNENKKIIFNNILFQIDDELSNTKNLIIDSSIKYISNDLFKSKKYETITLNEGLVGIYDNAFASNSLITVITFPSTLKFIGNKAFENNKLESITFLGNSLESIGDNAFSSSSSKVTTLDLPNNLVSIGNSAFKNFSKLESVNASSNLNVIGDSAFENCSNLVSFNLPSDVNLEIIGEKAFYGNKKLQTLNLGSNLKNVGSYAFASCSLYNPSIPLSIQNIGAYAFAYSGVTTLNIGANIECIAEGAFNNCTSLNSIVIAENAFSDVDNATIYKDTFTSCVSLTKVNIPSGISYIEEEAFKDCTSLIDIDCKAVSVNNNAFTNTKWEKETSKLNDGLIILGNKLLKYEGDETKVTIPSGVEIINNNAFANSAIKEINLPSSLKEIDSYAFYNSKIEKVNINENSLLSLIKESSFEKCYYLKYINLENTQLETLENNAFKQANALNTLNLPNSLKTIGDYAFFETSIKEINIPSSLTSIGSYAFANLGVSKNLSSSNEYWDVYSLSLSSLSFENNSNLEYIGKYAFYNNEIETINLPNNNLLLDDCCLASSLKLKEFTLLDNYEFNSSILANASSISKLEISGTIPVAILFGGYASNVPTSLKEIVVNASSTSITDSFLNGCGMVTNISLPNSITSIGNMAFAMCREIKEINLENVKEIGSLAFYGCNNLENIYYSSSLNKIGDKAFFGTKWLENQENVEFVTINNILIKFNNINNVEDVIVTDSIITVSGGAFAGNDKIKTITFSKNTLSLANGAFDSCTSLNKITLKALEVVNIDLYIFDTLSSFTIDVNNDIINAYKENIYWSLYIDLLK